MQMCLEQSQPFCPGRTCGLGVFTVALFQAVSHTASWRLSPFFLFFYDVGWDDSPQHFTEGAFSLGCDISNVPNEGAASG